MNKFSSGLGPSEKLKVFGSMEKASNQFSCVNSTGAEREDPRKQKLGKGEA